MSSITVVRKDGYASIAADTLTTFGNTKESADYIANSGKIISYKDGFLGVSGSACLQIALEDFLSRTKKTIPLGNVAEIFRFGLSLHKSLKDNYFLQADDEDDFETFRGDILIVGPNGIFGISAYRYVQEFKKFYANGSGSEYALGAMYAVYSDEEKNSEAIAKLGVEAGAEFDDGSGLPLDCYTIKLKK